MRTRRHRIAAAALAAALIVPLAAHDPAFAGLKSAKVAFVRDEWTDIGLLQDGVRVVNYRISLSTNVSMNPLKVGAGPAIYFNVKNEGTAGVDFSLAVALFDKNGGLLAAASGSHVGQLDPGESREMKLIFRDVNERVQDAATAQVAIETRL